MLMTDGIVRVILCSFPIKRHIKIRAEANTFDPKFEEYFEWRERIIRGSQRISTQQIHPDMNQI
jgi:hypothetical protein